MKPKLTDYVPALDGLRAISIILVYLSHVFYYSGITTATIIPGGFGVTIFFFISGFLITRLLVAELISNSKIDLKGFYIRRLLRLYPPLLCMLIIMTSFLVIAQNIFPWKELLAALFYYENYFITFHNMPDKLFDYYGILWSLAVEEHFYIFYPLVLILFGKKPKVLLPVIIALTILPLAFRFYATTKFAAGPFQFAYTYQLSHTRYDSILFGCISALVLDRFKNVYLRITSNKLVFAGGLALIFFSLLFRSDAFRNSFRYTVQGIGLFILIPPVLYTLSYSFINKLLSTRSMVYIGKLSYSFYLYHFVLIVVMMHYPLPSKALYVVVNFGASVVLSLLSYNYIEQPFFRLRKKFGSRIQEEVLPAEQSSFLQTEPAVDFFEYKKRKQTDKNVL